MQGPTATVKGILLEPGERVVYFDFDKGIGTRIAFFFIGILLIPVLGLGLLLVWAAFKDQSKTMAVTTHRFIRIEGKDAPKIIRHGDVAHREEVLEPGRGLKEITLRDRNGTPLTLPMRGNTVLRDLVRRLVEQPGAVNALPNVPFDP